MDFNAYGAVPNSNASQQQPNSNDQSSTGMLNPYPSGGPSPHPPPTPAKRPGIQQQTHTPQPSPPDHSWQMGQMNPYSSVPKPDVQKQDSYPVTSAPWDPQYMHSMPAGMNAPPLGQQQNWDQKNVSDLDVPNLEPDFGDIRENFFANDEQFPIVDLRFGNGQERNDQGVSQRPAHPRRHVSESSNYSMSSSNLMPEVSGFDDLNANKPAYANPETEQWPKLDPGPGLLSPMPSPKVNEVKPGSRHMASPAPRKTQNVRASPYTLESDRHKRWAGGSSAPQPHMPHMPQLHDRFGSYQNRMHQQPMPQQPMPSYPFAHQNSLNHQTQNILYSQPSHLGGRSGLFPMGAEPVMPLEVPRPLPSQGLYKVTSTSDRHGTSATHFADLSDPPDLYSTLREVPDDPPESDMHPEDPELTPHEQDLRFEGDMYTPKWVRGHGNKREGWCGLCKPGRWLVLKNSAYWYDKSFTHGVSAATGAAFQGPTDSRRTEGNPDVWEGLCSSCADWVPLVSSKKKGTTWFRHAYRCHTHPKVKDGSKRRRETSTQNRNRASSNASNGSQRSQYSQHSTHSNLSSHNTPQHMQGPFQHNPSHQTPPIPEHSPHMPHGSSNFSTPGQQHEPRTPRTPGHRATGSGDYLTPYSHPPPHMHGQQGSGVAGLGLQGPPHMMMSGPGGVPLRPPLGGMNDVSIDLKGFPSVVQGLGGMV